MKYLYNCLILILVVGCSDFSESLKGDLLSSKDITISDFNTDFPIVKLTVDQDEFDNMYSNFEEEIEIEVPVEVITQVEKGPVEGTVVPVKE